MVENDTFSVETLLKKKLTTEGLNQIGGSLGSFKYRINKSVKKKKFHVFCNKTVKSLSHASTAHVDSTILAMLKPLANEEKFKQRRHDVSANKI